MRSVAAMSAVVVVGLVGLSACGGGDVELSQAQTAEVLLTGEEFPLDGFTRGEVEEQDPATASASGGSQDGSLGALLEGQEVPQECRDALEATDLGGDDVTAQSTVTFTQGDDSVPLPTSVELVVATVDGQSPLEPLAAVNDECEEITLEQQGVSLTMTFQDLEDLEGTKVSLGLGELSVDMLMGGTMEDTMVVAGFATGVQEAQLADVIEAQVGKLADVSE